MEYLLIILIPVSFALGAFTAVKTMQIGLRWKIQIEKQETPTVSSPMQPIADVLNDKKIAKIENKTAQTVKEWFYGK